MRIFLFIIMNLVLALGAAAGEYLEESILPEDSEQEQEQEVIYFDNLDSDFFGMNKIYKMKIEQDDFYFINKNTGANYTTSDFFQFFTPTGERIYSINYAVQKIEYEFQPGLKIRAGQTQLTNYSGTTPLFLSEAAAVNNQSTQIMAKGRYGNFSTGIFDSSIDSSTSTAAMFSTKPAKLFKNGGEISFGTALYSYDVNALPKNSTGLFSEYKKNRLTLNTQIAKAYSGNSNAAQNKIYIIPEYMLTSSLSLKLVHRQNFDENSFREGIGLKYKPQNHKNNFEFELNAATKYTDTQAPSKNIRFMTKFRL